MHINYNTDRLVILNYPAGAGGKLISLCLALNPEFLHQDKTLAEARLAGRINETQSFQISKTVLNKNKSTHFELGCRQLAKFNASNKKEDQTKLANNLWKKLTNQTNFYFCMVDWSGGKWSHYPNAQHIIFENYQWILKKRKKTIKKINFEHNLKGKNIVYIDQASIKDSEKFKKEIKKLFLFFKFNEPNWDYVESLRSTWLKTFTIGFNKKIKEQKI